MPERADEAMMASDDIRDDAMALLTKAASLWADGGVEGGSAASPGAPGQDVGDRVAFVTAYYRRVAPEDLIAAGPDRLAETVARHAALGASRPQGRPAVGVRPAQSSGGAVGALTSAGTVVDIVTDDMPYLVDSVTMELNRHAADIRLIVHPVLTVRRDVAGTAHGIALAGDGSVSESWIHVELGQVADEQRLAEDLRRVLDDLRVAMEDQRRMRGAARELVAVLTDEGGSEEAEASELLAWLTAGHFTFLGYRKYDLVKSDDNPDGAELKPVPGTGLGILRHDRIDSFAVTPPKKPAGQRRARLLVLAKSSIRSTVYRPKYLDYVAVRTFSPQTGEVTGEYRFLGLYTQAAFTESITRIPVLRRKLDGVLAAAGLTEDSHDGKALTEILEGYPLEELFEISTEQLVPIARGVLGLGERKQVRLFLRPDAYGRYVSCLVYLPRDRYTTQVRLRVQEILRTALGGDSVDYGAMVGNSALARLHVVVYGAPGHPLAAVDQAALQARVAAAVRSWDEDLAAEAERQLGPARAAALLRLSDGIPETYKTDTTAVAAVEDLAVVLRLQEGAGQFDIRLSISQNGPWRLRLFRLTPITLSDVLPQLQHMGLEVLDEHPYEFAAGDRSFWIYDFSLQRTRSGQLTAAEVTAACTGFESTLGSVWRGQTEDDDFNGLVLDAGLTWRQVVLLRAYARYLRQAGTQFSQAYLQRVLRSNPAITRLLVRFFESRFDPVWQDGAEERCTAIGEELRGSLDDVMILDHDRILRSYLALIEATLRTNYFQLLGDGERAPYLVLKLAPGSVPGVPEPRPKFEIFVYSPRLEAVHLRFGAVARGRGARPGQGAGGEELGHRAVGREGRVRLQAAARSGRPRRLPARGAGLLPDVHQRDARHHRQHRRRRGGAAGGRGPPRRRRPVPGGGGGQGHRDVLRRGQRDRPQVPVLAGRRVRLRWFRGLRPQEDGHHRPRRLGVGPVALRRPAAQPRHRRVHRGRRRGHVGRRVRQRDAAFAPHEAGGRVRPPARVR
jgi:glutamate dehydrogenase